jgi:hypothetical protein
MVTPLLSFSVNATAPHRATMNIHEITVQKPVPASAVFFLLVILSEMPFPEFGKAVLFDEPLLRNAGAADGRSNRWSDPGYELLRLFIRTLMQLG